MPSSENRYIFELDNFPSFAALEATPPKKKHTAFKHHPGNQPNPDLGRGNFECEEMTVKHAHGVGGVLGALSRYYDLYLSGVITDKLNGRFIVMDEAGLFPETIYELQDCVMTNFGAEQHTGTGTNISQFSFSLLPTDFRTV